MPPAQPRLENAFSGVNRLFQTHDVVMFSEIRHSGQEYEWLSKLVKTPEFANEVNDIVLESGNPIYRKTLEQAVHEANLQRPGKPGIRLLTVGARDQQYAQLVKKEVLAKHRHALLIMAAGHFLRGHDQPLDRELLAAGAKPYVVALGTNVIDSRGDVDKRFDSWPSPVITPLSGNWVGALPAQPVISGGHAAATPLTLADQADALLYVGPQKKR
jgi:hypothetical protein